MEKDFTSWMRLKEIIHTTEKEVFCHAREIWWCSLGVNIGTEIDGKYELFERPVLIIKVYNTESMLVLPVTTKQKEDKFHCKVVIDGRSVYIKLTQVRTISKKRLIRKLDILDKESFSRVVTTWKNSI